MYIKANVYEDDAVIPATIDEKMEVGGAAGIASKHSLGVIRVGDNLKISDDGTLSVDTAAEMDEDNTKPITAAAVAVQVGNIEILLGTI